jgi:tRNA pseudouridine32 synthase / 23S rRNA pseudouridine746 synthase
VCEKVSVKFFVFSRKFDGHTCGLQLDRQVLTLLTFDAYQEKTYTLFLYESWPRIPKTMEVGRRLCLFSILLLLFYIVGSLTVDAFPVTVLSPSSPTTLPPNEFSHSDMDGIATLHNLTQTCVTVQHVPTDLYCPSTFASSPFRATSLRVSFTCPSRTGNSILPLQTYHLKRIQVKPNCHEDSVMTTDPIRIPNLAFVIQNQHLLNLSVSSTALLQQYQKEQKIIPRPLGEQDKATTTTTTTTTTKMSSMNPTFLLNKIRTEHQAAQPLSRDMLQILYCDEHICVVNKPSGVLSVPGPRRNPSIANLLYDVLKPPSSQVDQTVVHRLDMATSGILVYALTLEALKRLHDDFKERRVYKLYQCLVDGHVVSTTTSSWEGEIDVALERDPSNPPFMRVAQHDSTTKNGEDIEKHKFWREQPKPSLTQYRILGHEKRNGKTVTRLEMKPLTGRTHQLRVHTAQVLGTPIVGDDIYGRTLHDHTVEGPLCLHAQKLCIQHPISGAHMIFQVDAPF